MSDTYCDQERLSDGYSDGGTYRHCLHDTQHLGEASKVCCHCGDLFLADEEPNGIEHGEYAPRADRAACTWKHDASDEDDVWHTGCGQAWCPGVGTPTSNGMRFCPYCGLTLFEVANA